MSLGQKRRIAVLGDIMLDRYLWGGCSRISPEAPVQVVDVHRETKALGGAGNVVTNLRSLGAEVSLLGVTGDDAPAEALRSLLEEHSTSTARLLRDPARSTSNKTRVVAARQQVVRVDVESRDPISGEQEARLLGWLRGEVERCEAIILSDYGKGVITESLSRAAIDLAREHSIPVLCDPKGIDYSKYARATIVTPNRKEASEASGITITDRETLDQAGSKLLADHRFCYLLVTLSEEGMALFSEQGLQVFPTKAREVFDVSGAGDTVVAGLALALAQGKSIEQACHFANIAAGIVVGKIGTATATLDEIRRFDRPRHRDTKLKSRSEMAETVRRLRAQGHRICFTNGCFDLLHAGHVSYLETAREMGDVLIVGLNSDASVRRIKESGRPIHNQQDRAIVLAALAPVDYVVLFDEETPYDLISAIEPDVLVKGGDYEADDVVGADVVRRRGGSVQIVEFVEGLSSSKTIARILEGNK